MVDVRKTATRLVALGIGAAMAAGVMTTAEAQSSRQSSRQNLPAQRRARRESNASRQARIARTVQQTYAHPYEVMGGGGFLRWKSGPYTQRNDEVSWNAQGDYYLNPRLAIVADAQGSFGHAKPLRGVDNTNIQAGRPQINEYFFTGGANYRFVRKEKYALGAQGTGGVAWGIFSGGAKGLRGTDVGLWNDGFKPAFTLSLNADYNVFPNLAVRLAPTYTATTFSSPAGGSSFQSNFGFNAGVVYRFGRSK